MNTAGQSMRRLASPRFAADTVVASGLVLAAMLATYARLYFGVDVEDEAFYAAIPYRFVLGDRPFVDELNAQQFSAALTYPLVKGWVWLRGDTTGIILFLRHAYFAFACGVAWAVFGATRRCVGTAGAMLLALVPLSFVPFNVPTLSYNTMGMGWLTLGVLSTLRAVDSERPGRWFVVAGAAHALACIAYPSLAVVPLVELALILVMAPGPRLENVLAYSLPVAVVAGSCAAAVFAIGFEPVRDAIEYTASGPPRYVRPFQGATTQLRSWGPVVGWLCALFAVHRFVPRGFVLVASTFPVVLFAGLARHEAHTDTLFFVIYLTAMAPLFVLWLGGDRDPGRARRIGIWVLLPSFAAALAFAWTSATGFWNSSLGLVPASILALAGLSVGVRRSLPPPWGRWAMLLPLVVTHVVLLFALFHGIYRDASLERLTVRVESGPYAGLYTTPSRRNLLDTMAAEIAARQQPDAKLLVYDAFAAGYLMTSMRPATSSIWLIDWPSHREIYVAGYERNLDPRNVVLHLKPNCRPRRKVDPLHDFVTRTHALVVDERCYQVYTGVLE